MIFKSWAKISNAQRCVLYMMKGLPKLKSETFMFQALVRGIKRGITSSLKETNNYGEFDPGSE